MYRTKLIVVIAMLALCLLFAFKIFGIDIFDTSPKLEVENVNYKNKDEENPEQIVFKYVKLVRERNFEDLEKLYTFSPMVYWQREEKKFNNELGSSNFTETKDFTTRSNNETSSEKVKTSVFDDIFHEFFAKNNPDFINRNNLYVSKILETEIDNDLCRVKVSFENGKTPPILKQDFFLYNNGSGWKIFKIQFP